MAVALLASLPGRGVAAGDTTVAIAAAAGTVYAIAGPRAAIVARRIEPEAAALAPPHDVVAPRESGPQPVAVAVVNRRLLAGVCRSGSSWTLETWSLDAGGAATPLQTLALGSAAGSGAGVSLAVSPTGEWLAIAGLPPPLAPVQRAAFAGRRLAAPSIRGCPRPPARPTAVAVSPTDELVIFEPPAGGGSVAVAFHGIAGRELLRLDTGLETVRGAGFDPADGALYVVGERRDGTRRAAGLWRLDAALVDGRQAIRPVLVAPLTGPLAMAVVAAGTAAVAHGTDGRTLELVPTAAARESSSIGGRSP
jgi:hypothetical protein